MQVKECMTNDVEVVSPEMPIIEAARKMKSGDFGALPVGANDRLIGMITDRDITIRAVAEGKQPDITTVGEVMTDKLLYCFENQDIEEVADIMSDHQVRRLPVLNEQKRLVGMVSLGDIAQSPEADDAQRALSDISKPQQESGMQH